MKRILALMLAFTVLCISNSTLAQTFRGIELDQGFNQHSSPVFGGDWFVDLKDTFSGAGRATQLSHSHVDDIIIGFVPPTLPVPTEPDEFGRWMGSDSYMVDAANGTVQRQDSQSIEVACIPWRVTPELGDYYLVELTSVVAEGESVRLAYFGDVSVHGTDSGLLGNGLGQLVLDVTRGEGVDAGVISWTVDSPNLLNPISSSLNVNVNDELRLQLGWNDDNNLYDAWIETANGNQQLASGSLINPIDVFGVGMELSGEHSQVSNFIAAVPEPSGNVLVLLSVFMLVVSSRTNRTAHHI